MVKNPPGNAGAGSLSPGQGTKIPNARAQLSAHTEVLSSILGLGDTGSLCGDRLKDKYNAMLQHCERGKLKELWIETPLVVQWLLLLSG